MARRLCGAIRAARAREPSSNAAKSDHWERRPTACAGGIARQRDSITDAERPL
jgi:hypothetical protein